MRVAGGEGARGRLSGVSASQSARPNTRPAATTEISWNDPLRRRMLAAADLLAALGAAAVAGIAGSGTAASFLCAAATLPLWGVAAKAHGLYDIDHARIRHLTADELPKLFHCAVLVTPCLALLFALVPAASLPAPAAVAMFVSLLACTITGRAAARALWRRIVPAERTLVLGDGELADSLARKFELEPGHHLEVVRFLSAADLTLHGSGSEDALAEIVARERVDRVAVALPELDEEVLRRVLAICHAHRLKLSVTPPIRAMLGTAVSLTHLAELPVIEFRTWDPSRSTMLLKRALDVAVAGGSLILLSPLMAVVAVAIRLDSRGAALFKQVRAGLGGKPFQ